MWAGRTVDRSVPGIKSAAAEVRADHLPAPLAIELMTPLTASDRFPRTHLGSLKDCAAPGQVKTAPQFGCLLNDDVKPPQPESILVGISSPQREPRARRLPALRVPQRTLRY